MGERWVRHRLSHEKTFITYSFDLNIKISITEGVYRMDDGAIKDLHYGCHLKFLSKLCELLGECNLKGFSTIMSVNP